MKTFSYAQITMSMTGSLMGYENNNEVNQAKCKKPLKPLPVVSSIGANGVTTVPAVNAKTRKSNRAPRKQESCHRVHVNGLWSVWYGILAVGLQAYVATRCAKRFIGKLPQRVSATCLSNMQNTINLNSCHR